MSTAILLIPGFFGFGHFAGKNGNRLDYFGNAAKAIAATRGEL